jgi:hypothetical protein
MFSAVIVDHTSAWAKQPSVRAKPSAHLVVGLQLPNLREGMPGKSGEAPEG